MDYFVHKFDASLYENEVRLELGLDTMSDKLRPELDPVNTLLETERVSTFVAVEPGVGLGNEIYRRIGSAPVSGSFIR